MNINEFDSLYRERVTALGVTGSDVVLELEKVNSGRIRVITHLAIEDKTSSYTKFRLSIYNGATEFMIDEAIYPEEDELLVHPKDLVLGESDVVRATLTGTVTGDLIEMHAIGWEMQREGP
jgi:hypothetical protein